LKAIEATLKEDEALLERIRAEQQLISSNPLISPDAKQVQLIASYRAQLDVIAKEMADLATKKTFLTDPAKVAEVDLQMGKLVNQARTLKQELFLATHPLQAELGRWAASFGDTMEQIAKTIEETVGVALQSLNTWITTGKFNLQSFMQSIEQLELKH